jgi:peptide/nickel transport system permease protein
MDLGRYALRRLIYAVPLVIGVVTAAFFIIHLIPGDPGRGVLGPHATPQAVAIFDRRLGLEKPLTQQYLDFFHNALTLNFGKSFEYRVPVSELLKTRVVPTTLLIVYGLLMAIVVTIPLALFASVRKDRAADHAVRVGGMIVGVMPTFWLGLVLALVFGLELGWFRTSGYGEDVGEVLSSLTLPAVALSLIVAPLLVRTLRASLIESEKTAYVEASRARGLSKRRVLYRYVLRNSLVSAVTVLGLCVVGLISGSVLVESVFSIPGLGTLLVTAVGARDYPVIQGLVVVMCCAVVLVNTLTDVAYALLDPRVRL